MKFSMEIFLGGVLKGAPQTYERELAQARKIHEVLRDRWNVGQPEQWKHKHLLWFLNIYQRSEKPETRYRYWLTVKKIMKRLSKEEDWTPRLKGSWTKAPR
jgi:hypothetical protein